MKIPMFAKPTLAADRELAAARAAGWRRADLAWERRQEKAHEAWVGGDAVMAERLWRRALWTARLRFPGGDLRVATSRANLALALRARGRERAAVRLYARARNGWNQDAVGEMATDFKGRARSSLFHLRMESKHRETYADNARQRLNAFVEETARALADIEAGRAPEIRLYERWRGEKPPVFDSRRKIMGACLLLAAPVR